MWSEKMPNGKVRFIEYYIDPYTEKRKRTSVIMDKETKQTTKEAIRLLTAKIDTLSQKTNTSDLTLGELLAEWELAHAKKVKARTMKNYEAGIAFIRSKLDLDVKIKNIDTRFVQDYYDSFDSYKINTYKLYIQPFRLLFAYAEYRDYLPKNPTLKAVIKKDDRPELSKKTLETHQVRDLLKEIHSRSLRHLIPNFCEFLFLTGLRSGEALALKWSEVDLEHKSIRVISTLDFMSQPDKPFLTKPKNNASIRTVDLPDRAVELLTQEQVYQKLNQIATEFVFVNFRGAHPKMTHIDQILRDTSKKLYQTTLTAHGLRHAHITMLSELGLPLKAVMDRVGHSNPNTTLKIYTHATRKMQATVIDKLNSHL